MSLKSFADNESGLTHTLEAMIGVFLIIVTIIYLTGNMPSSAQRSGDHSRVQLMNIGRDSLDLIVQTQIYEPSPDALKGILNRTYYLEADKEFVMINEPVNFTVYYLNNTLVKETLTLRNTTLGQNVITSSTFMKNITEGKTNYSWTDSTKNHSEFSIQAVDTSGFSNYVTVKVGDYHLDTDTYGIFNYSNDTNVTGVVYNSSGGISNLEIQISNETSIILATITGSGELIENFNNSNNWSTNGNKANDTTNKTEGNASMSVNSTYRDFWIKKDLIQRFDKFDILSFDFYSDTGNEIVTVELINGTFLVPVKTTMNRTKLDQKNWTKFNTMINIPDSVFINSIKITVSNINTQNYLFDNMRIRDGKFKFNWSSSSINTKGKYYINATDDNNNSSNMHLITYTDYWNGRTLWQNSVIYETMSVNLYETNNTGVNMTIPPSYFYVNSEEKRNINTCTPSTNTNYSLCLIDSPINKTIKFTANVSGDYYIYGYFSYVYGGGTVYVIYTNSILIHVLPLVNEGPIGNTCINKFELNEYMNRYLPKDVNYNIYLIDPEGKRFVKCSPKFKDGELINGYPTDEAVTVSRLMHIKYHNFDNNQDIDNIIELRMVLWYK